MRKGLATTTAFLLALIAGSIGYYLMSGGLPFQITPEYTVVNVFDDDTSGNSYYYTCPLAVDVCDYELTCSGGNKITGRLDGNGQESRLSGCWIVHVHIEEKILCVPEGDLCKADSDCCTEQCEGLVDSVSISFEAVGTTYTCPADTHICEFNVVCEDGTPTPSASGSLTPGESVSVRCQKPFIGGDGILYVEAYGVCVGQLCGNGVREGVEQCDPPNSYGYCGTGGIHFCQPGCTWGTCITCNDNNPCTDDYVDRDASSATYKQCVYNPIGAGEVQCELFDVNERDCCSGFTGCDRFTCEGGQCVKKFAGICTPGYTEQQPCGNCGTKTRMCQNNCQWPKWADVSCYGEGICSPGQSELCEFSYQVPGTRTCQADCSWSDCIQAGECYPAGIIESCGNCGTKTCQTGNYWGTCLGQGQCKPGSSKLCTNQQGCEHDIYCSNNCGWGVCPADDCSLGMTTAVGSCYVSGVPGVYDCTALCKWGTTCRQTGLCVPGRKQCNAATNAIELCNELGSWTTFQACGENYICKEKSDPICEYIPYCGDGTCDADESCVCSDCSCPAGQVCIGGLCAYGSIAFIPDLSGSPFNPGEIMIMIAVEGGEPNAIVSGTLTKDGVLVDYDEGIVTVSKTVTLTFSDVTDGGSYNLKLEGYDPVKQNDVFFTYTFEVRTPLNVIFTATDQQYVNAPVVAKLTITDENANPVQPSFLEITAEYNGQSLECADCLNPIGTGKYNIYFNVDSAGMMEITATVERAGYARITKSVIIEVKTAKLLIVGPDSTTGSILPDVVEVDDAVRIQAYTMTPQGELVDVDKIQVTITVPNLNIPPQTNNMNRVGTGIYTYSYVPKWEELYAFSILVADATYGQSSIDQTLVVNPKPAGCFGTFLPCIIFYIISFIFAIVIIGMIIASKLKR